MGDVPAASGFETWQAAYRSAELCDTDFETMSGVALDPVYAPDGEPRDDVSWPGQFP
jgi:hypothetical protein